MKPAKNIESLADSLRGAMEAPVGITEASPKPPAKIIKARKGRPTRETVGITLRLPKSMLTRYTLDAAERTKEKGRVISAQEVMLEQLAAKS